MIYTKKLIILSIALVVLGLSFNAVQAKKDKDDDEHHTPRPTATCTPTTSPTASPVPTQEPTTSPSATPFSTPIENETPRPILGKDPPEKSDPCYYLSYTPECQAKHTPAPNVGWK